MAFERCCFFVTPPTSVVFLGYKGRFRARKETVLSVSLLSICHLPVSFPLRHILPATRHVVMKLDTRPSPTVLPVRISCVRPHHRRAPHPAGQSPYPDEIYDAERNLSSRTARRTPARERNPTGPDPTSGRKI